MPFYSESPFERIIDIHWKPPDDGGGGDGGDGFQCGSGWFPMTAYFPGGDGFPQQPIIGSAIMLVEHGGTHWNPAVAHPPEDDPYRFFVPGLGASHLTLRIGWDMTPPIPPLRPLQVGIWVLPGRAPYPPYPDADDNPLPPSEQPPYCPPTMITPPMVGPGDMVFDGPEVQIGKNDPPCTVVVDYASDLASSAAAPVIPFEPFIPSVRADGDPPHFGFPGDPADQVAIWISVEYDCGGL